MSGPPFRLPPHVQLCPRAPQPCPVGGQPASSHWGSPCEYTPWKQPKGACTSKRHLWREKAPSGWTPCVGMEGWEGVRGSEGISPAPGVTSQNESSPGAGRVRAPSASPRPLWRGVPPGPHHGRNPPRTCPESQSVPSSRGVRQNSPWEPQMASVHLQTRPEPLAAVPRGRGWSPRFK